MPELVVNITSERAVEVQTPTLRTVEVSRARGPRGEPGPEGMSAYEVAVANGFTGTETEWLEGLAGGTAELVQAHVDDPTPHPAYDDLPSFTLLFENGLV